MISNSSALSEFGTGNEVLPVLDDVEKGRLWDWFRPRRVESIEKALQQLVVLLVVPIGENWREVKCRRLISISTSPRLPSSLRAVPTDRVLLVPSNIRPLGLFAGKDVEGTP